MNKRQDYPHPEQIRQLPALISQVIPEKWEDQNGHINVSYYMALYNESGWPMLDLIGVDERYFDQRKMGLADLDNHLHYLKELHVGDRVTAYGRFLSCDRKRMHGMLFIVNDNTNSLACTIEFMSISMDLDKRRSAAIPDDVAARLKTVIEAHQGLDWAPPTCMSIPPSG